MDDEKQQLQKQLEASAEDAASSQIDRNELLHQIHVLEGVRKTLEVPSLALSLALILRPGSWLSYQWLYCAREQGRKSCARRPKP